MTRRQYVATLRIAPPWLLFLVIAWWMIVHTLRGYDVLGDYIGGLA